MGKGKADGKAAIFVGVRIRPLLGHDKVKQEVVKNMDRQMLVALDPAKVNKEKQYLGADRTREKRYTFDAVFGPDSTQMDVHRAATEPPGLSMHTPMRAGPSAAPAETQSAPPRLKEAGR